MSNGIKYFVTFALGAAVGSVAAWSLLKSKYENLAKPGKSPGCLVLIWAVVAWDRASQRGKITPINTAATASPQSPALAL